VSKSEAKHNKRTTTPDHRHRHPSQFITLLAEAAINNNNNNNNNNTDLQYFKKTLYKPFIMADVVENEVMTAFHPTTEPTILLPLHRTWALFYDDPNQNTHPDIPWKDKLQLCGEFSTAQEFWTIFNNIVPSSQIPMGANYHLFCKGILPAWEDPANMNGGKFVMTMPKKDSRAGKCDEWWLFSVLAVIGETMDMSGDEICGVVVSVRKSQDRIALWLKSCNKDACVKVGTRWKKALQVTDKTVLKYQSHKDAAASGTSYQNQVLFEA
jgi:translation initiation factor 4E